MIHYAENTAVAGLKFIMPDENPAVTGIIPEEYMTGDEFSRQVKAELTQLYQEYGLL